MMAALNHTLIYGKSLDARDWFLFVDFVFFVLAAIGRGQRHDGPVDRHAKMPILLATGAFNQCV